MQLAKVDVILSMHTRHRFFMHTLDNISCRFLMTLQRWAQTTLDARRLSLMLSVIGRHPLSMHASLNQCHRVHVHMTLWMCSRLGLCLMTLTNVFYLMYIVLNLCNRVNVSWPWWLLPSVGWCRFADACRTKPIFPRWCSQTTTKVT